MIPNHDSLLHRLRMPEPVHRFVDDPAGERQQREGIQEGGQHSGAMVAVGLGFVGRFGLQPESHPGQQQRPGIGEIVARI
jgi:hypothetical protein